MELITETKYKNTTMGSIPEDWDIKEFREVMDGFASGQTPYRAIREYYNGNIPWITSGELNYNIVTDTIEKITSEAVRRTNLKIIPKGTFLMAITGLEAAGTRGSCAITGIDATTNQSCMALYPKKGLLTTGYLYHYYVKYGDYLAFKYCQGTKQQSYTGGIAKTLPIIVPPTIEEQTAIANALSDADALIAGLEKLIAKKKKIKQGMMQRLFRPNPDSDREGWEVKRLGEIARITMGQSPLSEFYNDNAQGLPLIQGNADLKDRKTIKRYFTTSITKRGYTGNIILSVRAPVGAVAKASFDCCLGRGVCAIDFPNDYLYHFLIFIENGWQGLSSGSTFDSINSTQLADVKISIPSDISEQLKVSSILNDLDKELDVLKTKLTKAIAVKQGMMQNLLTGRVRLV